MQYSFIVSYIPSIYGNTISGDGPAFKHIPINPITLGCCKFCITRLSSIKSLISLLLYLSNIPVLHILYSNREKCLIGTFESFNSN